MPSSEHRSHENRRSNREHLIRVQSDGDPFNTVISVDEKVIDNVNMVSWTAGVNEFPSLLIRATLPILDVHGRLEQAEFDCPVCLMAWVHKCRDGTIETRK